LYPLESGELLSFWDEQSDRSSSHQFICAAPAPVVAVKDGQLVCPGDEAVLKRRFPSGVTSFIRLFPGQKDVDLLVTSISSKDLEMLSRDWRKDTAMQWTSLPFAPFIKSYDIRLKEDQVLVLPEGSVCAIRASDPTRRVFYYTKFAVFPDLGGANFVLDIFDESSSFSQKVVLWNAAHRLNDWLEDIATDARNGTSPAKQARVKRLREVVIHVRQCVAHLAATVVPPDPDWNWKRLVQDLDHVLSTVV